jgi:beta-galactosidase
MKRRSSPYRLPLLFLILLAAVGLTTASAQRLTAQPETTPLRVDGTHFTLNGKPFRILSGELEYARIPRADWRDRLRKVHALGLNTITVYIFWNLHEPSPGVYDFTGQNDVAEFLREAHDEGLYVILRPGPYVCAEWDLGGYPSWLLKTNPALDTSNHTVLLRSPTSAYLTAARRWLLRLGQEIAPLQASRGGPIIAVQVENEYGSFIVPATERSAYLPQVLQMVRDAGFGDSFLYTADGGDVLAEGSIQGLLAAVDYGTGDAARSLALLHHFQPNAPTYVAEYWDGWFDHWGEAHQITDAAKQLDEIRAVLEAGGSINLYMVHGGTTFGWHNGANSGHDGLNTAAYQPDVSSYDYDAPIDEAGRLRPKYFALRDLIAKETGATPPPVPAIAPFLTLPAFKLTASRPLLQALPAGVQSASPLAMEDLSQAFGYILYRTKLPATTHDGILALDALHSYTRIYLNGQLEGILDRRLGQTQLTLKAKPGQQLDLLVENGGRINFTTAIRGERAGILGEVRLNGLALNDWTNIPLPLNVPPAAGFSTEPCTGPCLYTATLNIPTPGDTYLNTTHLGKGVIWVNDHLVGRFWNVGPMGSLFLPGAWLHQGANTVTVLDWNGGPPASLSADDHPTYLVPSAEKIIP